MADDQGSDALTAWGPTVDNNIVGIFTGPTTLTPVDGMPSGILEDAIPQMAVGLFAGSLEGTPWGASGDAPDFIDPDPQILSTMVDEDGNARFVGEAGPTDAPFVTIRWEVLLQPSIVVCLLEKNNELMASRITIDDTILLPSTISLEDGVLRLTVVPQTDLLVIT